MSRPLHPFVEFKVVGGGYKLFKRNGFALRIVFKIIFTWIEAIICVISKYTTFEVR